MSDEQKNGRVLDLSGKVQNAPLVGGEHKRAHDSDRVNGIRNHLSQVMAQMKQGWAADMGMDPQGATQPNVAAIRQHWSERWVDTAVKAMNSTDPVEVDPEALDKWIGDQLAARKRSQEMATPLHAIADLEPMGFKLLGLHKGATVWVSTECTVMLVQGGMTCVYVRPQDVSPNTYVQDLVQLMNTMVPDLSLPDYRLGELMNLLGALRRERPVHPEEVDMETARKYLSPAQP